MFCIRAFYLKYPSILTLKRLNQLEELLKDLDNNDLKKEGQQLLDKLKTWDGEMVQRKSQAYDDVENFPNKFTAEYLFVMNHCSSALPQINQPSKER